MYHLAKPALLVAALSAPLALGVSPALGDEAAAQPTLTTIKSDRGVHSAKAQAIFTKIAAED
ncbi:hypothetical protein [Jannaschia marina]|uniref:hypothetical protein n=1 Tax=Jannaschia marina TaxID=2741674 RepID=UPI0015C85D87|nr:hypothetical protein [Jannaschia marina]